MSVSTVVKYNCGLGEGPLWEASSQSLFYVDIHAGDVHKWNSLTGQDEVKHFDDTVSVVIPAQSGGYVVSLGRKLVKINWTSGEIVQEYCEVDDDLPNNLFNDGKCDASGRLWAGTIGAKASSAVDDQFLGSLFSLEKDGTVRKHISGINLSNGLAWSADNRIMYYVDTIPGKVYAFDFDLDSGTMSNQRVAISFPAGTEFTLGVPDGMTIDTEGKLWIAFYYGGRVARFDPETGTELRSLDMPANQITSCCFGGPTFEELYVTSSKLGLSEDKQAQQPLAGSVFKVTGLGVKGTAATEFAG